MRQTVIIKFAIGGLLRFVSHQEMLRLWTRLVTRAGIALAFSEGFNPHPRISLPLPRSVAVESDDEVITVLMESPDAPESEPGTCFDESACKELQKTLEQNLPDGITISEVTSVPGRISMHASGASYILPLAADRMQCVMESARAVLDLIARHEAVTVQRSDDTGRTRPINASEYFVAASELVGAVSVKCKITQSGSLRINEILELLHVEPSMLEGPVKRTAVQWHQN